MAIEVAPAVKSSTRQSRLASDATAGQSPGASATIVRRAQTSSRRPAAAPAVAISAPSISTCRASLSRDPPTAARTENSRSRRIAETRKRLARLAQATSSTNSATACRRMSAGRAFETSARCHVSTCAPAIAALVVG